MSVKETERETKTQFMQGRVGRGKELFISLLSLQLFGRNQSILPGKNTAGQTCIHRVFLQCVLASFLDV